jgi:hypothetical protein
LKGDAARPRRDVQIVARTVAAVASKPPTPGRHPLRLATTGGWRPLAVLAMMGFTGSAWRGGKCAASSSSCGEAPTALVVAISAGFPLLAPT